MFGAWWLTFRNAAGQLIHWGCGALAAVQPLTTAVMSALLQPMMQGRAELAARLVRACGASAAQRMGRDTVNSLMRLSSGLAVAQHMHDHFTQGLQR